MLSSFFRGLLNVAFNTYDFVIHQNSLVPEVISRFSLLPGGGGFAQWLGPRITDQGIPGSSPGRGAVRSGLEHVHITVS